MSETLLIEILTEELPPKALEKIGNFFANNVFNELKSHGFLNETAVATAFFTPRRLAVTINNVRAVSTDRIMRKKVMPISVALDSNGNKTRALARKMEIMAAESGQTEISISELERAYDGKVDSLFYNYITKGTSLFSSLQELLGNVIAKLPTPKIMHYQRSGKTICFIRPAHSLVVLHGNSILPVKLLDLDAGRITKGHRFLSSGEIILDSADNYASILNEQGKVIASFGERKEKIRRDLLLAAGQRNVLMPKALLDEVAALVEWPVVYRCEFEEGFLSIPQECLILTMQTNQKYFALTNNFGKLCSHFLVVSNLKTGEAHHIIKGNERVVRARLLDARFFFEQDKRKRLVERVPLLADVVYHNKLGNQLQRVERIKGIAVKISTILKNDIALVERTVLLAKADLLTEMVGEFPELQGIMGRYYAIYDGEEEDVGLAISEHYKPRFSGDSLPMTNVGITVGLAEKLEILIGIWGIGLYPTGEKDPFALRRHALGILRILMKKCPPISLRQLILNAAEQFTGNPNFQNPSEDVLLFLYDRLRSLLRERGYNQNEIEAVISRKPDLLNNIIERLDAVQAFSALPGSENLIMINKRINNILRKVRVMNNNATVQKNLLHDSAERSLFEAMNIIKPEVNIAYEKDDFSTALQLLICLQSHVSNFFENVMVMADNEELRDNRLRLLTDLHLMLNQVSDISKLKA